MWPYPWTHVGTPSHLGHMDRVAATMPSQAHAGAAQEAPDIGQWEGQDVPLVRPSSCNVKGGIPSSRRYLPTYLPTSNTFLVAKDGRVQGFVPSLALTPPPRLGAGPGLPPAAVPLCLSTPDWDGSALPTSPSCHRPSWGPWLQGLR